MKLGRLLAISVFGVWSCASAPQQQLRTVSDVSTITSTRLERFQSEAEFYDYMSRLRRVARARHLWWAEEQKPEPDTGALYGQDAGPPPPPPPAPPPPPPAMAAGQPTASPVVVTASRNPSSESTNPSITNVQTRGVDEGDIVKQIGHFLIVLQDGRLFTVDLHPVRARLAFVDRVNVYRNASTESWYDEMLVYRNRIVVTGYSYVRQASEVTVFAMSDEGRLTREAVYYMSSNDYYDPENYATRLVDDNLVVYSPLNLAQQFPKNRVSWPTIRRWIRGDGEHMVLSKAEPLFDARDIYRPVQPTLEPTIHSISVCPLGSPRHGDELQCSATAFIGPPEREFYIAPDAAYLWISGRHEQSPPTNLNFCDTAAAGQLSSAVPGALFRAPFGGGAPGVIGVHGEPRNQFGLASTPAEFRALLLWNGGQCGGHTQLNLKYFSAPLSAFNADFTDSAAERFVDLPPIDTGMYENRFTDDYVVYGTRDNASSYPPADNEALPPRSHVVAVPLANPTAPVTLDAPHNVLRVERVGATDLLLTGYANHDGLSLSVLDLTAAPRFSTTTTLNGRFESEGRSHAFNSRIGEGNTGLLGLPTVHAIKRSGRWVWNSTASDLSYLSLTSQGLTHLGELRAHANSVDSSYHCEVSCVDWYGNSRPIFTDGRIFALSATELIEGRVERGRMVEIGRVNLTRRLRR